MALKHKNSDADNCFLVKISNKYGSLLSEEFTTHGGCPHGVMIKAMDCGIVVSEFKLQSSYYVHFRTNTLRQSYETPYPPSYGSNSTTTVFFRRMALALNNQQRLICH